MSDGDEEVRTSVDGVQVGLEGITSKEGLRQKLLGIAEGYEQASKSNIDLGLKTTLVSVLGLALTEIGGGYLQTHGVSVDSAKPYIHGTLFVLGGVGAGMRIAGMKEKMQSVKAKPVGEKIV